MHSAIAAVAALTLVVSAAARAAADITPERSHVLSTPMIPVDDSACVRGSSVEVTRDPMVRSSPTDASDRAIASDASIMPRMSDSDEVYIGCGPQQPWWILQVHAEVNTMLTTEGMIFFPRGVELDDAAGGISRVQELGFGVGVRLEYYLPWSQFGLSVGLGYDRRSASSSAPVRVDTTLIPVTSVHPMDNPPPLAFEQQASGSIVGFRAELLGTYDFLPTKLSVFAGLGFRITGWANRRVVTSIAAPSNAIFDYPNDRYLPLDNPRRNIEWSDRLSARGIPLYAKLGGAYWFAMGQIDLSPWVAVDWQFAPLMRDPSWRALGITTGIEVAIPLGT